jgi:branched-chain amino acid transport system substrate-binding protein
MVQHRSFLAFVALVLLIQCRPASPPQSCTDAIGCVKVGPEEPIRIAALQVLSGDQEILGTSNLRSIELALDERDRTLLDHPIDLRTEDSLCSREGGATAAAKMVADPEVVAILGPTCSGAAAGAIKTVSEAGLVMVSGSSTAPSLTSIAGKPSPDWRPGFLRTAQNDALSGRAAATFATEKLGATRAATIDDGDPYTKGLTDAFEQGFAELGGEVVLAVAVNKGDTDMGPVLTAVARSGVELVFLPVFRPEGDNIVMQAREFKGLEDVILMSAEGMYLEDFVETVGVAAIGLHMVIPVTPEGPAHDAFAARYVQEYGELPSVTYYAHSYDAANLLLNAIEAVAEQTPDRTLQIGRQALRDVLYATAGYEGLTGSLSCDEYGDCGPARFQVVRMDDPAAGLEGMAANVIYNYPRDR